MNFLKIIATNKKLGGFMKYLSDNYLYLLRKNNLNSQKLSKLLGGKPSQPTLSRLEKKPVKFPRRDTVQAIADYFDVPIDDFMDKPLWLESEFAKTTIHNMLSEPRINPYTAIKSPRKKEVALAQRTMPLLEIDQALEYVTNPTEASIVNCELVSTTLSHSDRAFAVKMFDNSMKAENTVEEAISKGEILIAEPQIPPRHEDIVVVNLNPEKRIGMVAKLEIDPFGNRRLRRTGINIAGENPMELPKGAFICGVVIEVKRRTISPYEVENRIKNEYNPIESIEK